MSSPQQNVTIAAPGFAGINTEISPTEQSDNYASIAENCIIDKYGRLGSRKGVELVTTDSTAITGVTLNELHVHQDVLGVETTISAGDNRIFKGEEVPVDVTPVGATITDNHWDMISFNDDCYLIQQDHTPIVYDASAGTFAEDAGIPEGSCGTGAFGRLWVSGVSGAESVIHWSNLLVGNDFTTGDTGTINVEEYWPTGYDKVVAILAHNGRLVVFGSDNILVFANVDGDPAAVGGMTLEDSIKGMGCLARDSVASIGTDVLFLDKSGVRSLSRTVTQNSLPIGDVSRTVNSAIRSSIAAELDKNKIGAVYSAQEGFYLLLFRATQTIYCFSTIMAGEDGALRVTNWPTSGTGASAIRADGSLALSGTEYIATYAGYTDLGASYKMRYFTNPLSFGDSTKLKFPKQVDFTLLAGTSGTATVLWAFDYGNTYRSKTISLVGIGSIAEYNVSEFGVAVYSAGAVLSRKKANVGGSGVVVQIGIELDIEGVEFSIQEINIQTLIGRMV